jgi:hypothetical protein
MTEREGTNASEKKGGREMCALSTKHHDQVLRIRSPSIDTQPLTHTIKTKSKSSVLLSGITGNSAQEQDIDIAYHGLGFTWEE